MKHVLWALGASALILAACGDGNTGANTANDTGANTPAEGDRTQGPVVSSSEEPRNPAVDTTPTTGDAGQTPGANSFTEAQARGAIESAGYSQVGELTQNEQGLWQGTAHKDGREVRVSVDYRGSVTEQ